VEDSVSPVDQRLKQKTQHLTWDYKCNTAVDYRYFEPTCPVSEYLISLMLVYCQYKYMVETQYLSVNSAIA